MKQRQGFIPLIGLVIILVVAIIAAGSIYYVSKSETTNTNSSISVNTNNTNRNTNVSACTMDAKLCPDGSTVGRVPPNCMFAPCPSANSNVNVNTNAAANMNTIVNANSNTNINTNTGSAIPADWQTYTNNEIGLSFRYPTAWGTVTAETVVPQDYGNGPEVTHGISTNISFQPPKINTRTPSLQANSSDFERFLDLAYNGGENLSLGCQNPGTISTDSYSYCELANLAGQATYIETTHFDMECSAAQYQQRVRLNLLGEKYAGLFVRLSDLPTNDQCMTPDSEKVGIRRTELTNLIQRTNLDDTVLADLETFDTFLGTIRITMLVD